MRSTLYMDVLVSLRVPKLGWREWVWPPGCNRFRILQRRQNLRAYFHVTPRKVVNIRGSKGCGKMADLWVIRGHPLTRSILCESVVPGIVFVPHGSCVIEMSPRLWQYFIVLSLTDTTVSLPAHAKEVWRRATTPVRRLASRRMHDPVVNISITAIPFSISARASFSSFRLPACLLVLGPSLRWQDLSGMKLNLS